MFEKYVNIVNTFVAKYWHFTILAVALLLLLFACGSVASAEEIKCNRPTTLSELAEQATKLTGKTPEIYTPEQLDLFIDWYNNSKYVQRFGKFNKEYVSGVTHLLISRVSLPTRVTSFMVRPGDYLAVALFENGCVRAWPIAAVLIQDWKKGVEADAS